MIKRVVFILLGVFVFFLSSCDIGQNFSDGLITISVSNLDQLAGFVPGTSRVLSDVYDDNDEFVVGSSISGVTGTSVSFEIGNPDYVFTGGDTYCIDVVVDINGNDEFDGGVDYWIPELLSVVIDGDYSVTLDNTGLVLIPAD